MQDNSAFLFRNLYATLTLKYENEPPTEEEFINDATDMRLALNVMYPVSDTEFEQILNKLRTKLTVIMETGVYIYDKNSVHQSWLPGRRSEIDFKYWNRYKDYLSYEKNWHTRVINSLDEISDTILNLLGDPKSEKPFQRRGLILGEVQSGKTANFTSFCNKAADAGYRVIIVLTGTIENLRQQTQERLDLEFSGRISRYLLDTSAAEEMKNQLVGVGLKGDAPRVVQFTSVIKDFDARVLDSNRLSLESVKENVPTLLVVKKNRRIIENLTKWLRKNNANIQDNKIHLPLLVIDDEADNASVNTNSSDTPTAINGAIRELLSLFYQASYVGVTATPFANIFINPDRDDEMYGEDLFPRDFIYALSPASNYIGKDVIFGKPGGNENFLIPITKKEMSKYFPFNHKKSHTISDLPDSLKEAIAYFILVNAILDSRIGVKEHRSMMIHVTRFTDVQEMLKNVVSDWLKQMQSDIRNYISVKDCDKTYDNLILLKNTWDKYNLEDKSGLKWKNFLSEKLYIAAAPIEVRTVNQRNSTLGAEYNKYNESGFRVIAIGGNSLSRGLTINGLCVSYFYRKSMMYDTLLQMCRWFGYMPNYEDLTKIWIGQEAIGWYVFISMASDELRDEINQMKALDMTPREFGLKVRQSPTSLIPTARNKMRATGKIRRPVNVSGNLIESPRLKPSTTVHRANERVFREFVKNLDKNGSRTKDFGQEFFWRGVDKQHIANLLREFETHPWQLAFQGGALADYIETKMNDDLWDVVIPEGEGRNLCAIECGDVKLNVRPELRKIKADDEEILISGHSVRIGAGEAAAIGLTKDEKRELKKKYLEKNPQKTNVPDKIYLVQGRKPIIFLHIVEPNLDKSREEGLIAPNIQIHEYYFAIGLGFPSTGAETQTADYIVNMVELKNMINPDEDIDE